MAEYLFTGEHPRLMFGLIQGVNAWHYPESGDPSQLAHGQTVVLEHGDSVKTDDEYPHAELELRAEETETPPAQPVRRAKNTKE